MSTDSAPKAMHAKEPWRIEPLEMHHSDEIGVVIISDDGEEIADNQRYYPKAITEANARRIVACVNYCEGIETDVMEAVVPTYGGARALANVDRLREQRDQLLAALRDAQQSLSTIADQAGRDEFMQDMVDVRGYANSRALATGNAIAATGGAT